MRAKLGVLVPVVLVAIALLFTRAALVAEAQANVTISIPFVCPTADSVRSMFSVLSTVVLMASIVVVILIILFNVFSFLSRTAGELAGFFTRNITFIFELLLIYILFLWGFNPTTMIQSDASGCAVVVWNELLLNGPLFFRIVGWILTFLGLPPPG